MADIAPTPGFQPAQTPGEYQSSENVPDYRVDLKNKADDGKSADIKAQQFEDLLNGQQQVTELQAKQQGQVFDPAQDIADNTVFQQPGQATPL